MFAASFYSIHNITSNNLVSILYRCFHIFTCVSTFIMNTQYQNVLLQCALFQGNQTLLDAQAAPVLFKRIRRRRNKRKPRPCWVHPWLSVERGIQFCHFDRLMAELRMEDQQAALQEAVVLLVALYNDSTSWGYVVKCYLSLAFLSFPTTFRRIVL